MKNNSFHPGQTRVEIGRVRTIYNAALTCNVFIDGSNLKDFVNGEGFVTYLPDGYHVFQVYGNGGMDEVTVCCNGSDVCIEIGVTRSIWRPRFAISQV
jgi:hypothetical protein